ncbi:hypothetical protein T265_05600 [Opisthorchis viverrini]|uniref:Uncharacterized protein n=1 Tax=Opisthorchis viverrini TaxID=6198 RepID=A0A074ZVF9_OPIVI|nr:hypothetical protein T265_05600 [Opisthorchis viverrini]KER27355.1 hypothetical protein T265_05600 [Opisthorchis viverrini]
MRSYLPPPSPQILGERNCGSYNHCTTSVLLLQLTMMMMSKPFRRLGIDFMWRISSFLFRIPKSVRVTGRNHASNTMVFTTTPQDLFPPIPLFFGSSFPSPLRAHISRVEIRVDSAASELFVPHKVPSLQESLAAGIITNSKTSAFNTDASLPYNHDLFESLFVKERIKLNGEGIWCLHPEVSTLPDIYSGNLDKN